MGTIVEFRLLVLDSLKYSSKAESSINRSAKAVISRDFITSRHNHLSIYWLIYFTFVLFYFFVFYFLFIFFYLFIYLFIFFYLFFFLIFYFIFHIFTENRHYRLICIAIATAVIGWPEWMKNIYLWLKRLNLAILAYFDKHY